MDAVYETTRNNLPSQELIFAKKIVNSGEYRPGYDSAYWRKPSMKLESVLQEIILATPDKKVPRDINLYCDTLHLGRALTIDFSGSDIELTIYTREIIILPAEVTADGTSGALLTVKTSDTASVGIYTPCVPNNLIVQFNIGGQNIKVDESQLHDGSGKSGVRVSSSEGKIEIEPRETLDVVFADYLGDISSEGTMRKTVRWQDDNLARLLQFQFLCAASNYQQDCAAAYKLLVYVCLMTEGNEGPTDFNYQASTLLMRLSAHLSQPVPYVPQVSLVSSRALLDSRLAAASTFETHFYRFITLQYGSGQLGSVVALMSSASDDTTQKYNVQLEVSKSRYTNALKSHTEALTRFTVANRGLEDAGKTFRTGINAWATAKRDEALREVGYALVGVVASIVICVASAGTTAPAVGASVVNAVGIVGKLKDIFVKLKALYEKFEPALTKIQEMVKTTKKILKTLETVKEVKDLPVIAVPLKNSTHDEVNGVAEWKIFTQEIDAMFEELKDHDISGKNEYKAILLKLPVLGKAVLVSQTMVISTGEDQTMMTLKENLATSQQKKVTACLETIDGDKRIFEMMKLVMFDRLMAVRGSVYMDFSLHSMAYIYHSLSSALPIRLSATKPVADYLEDAAKLQAAIITFDSGTKIQLKQFEITMSQDLHAIKQLLVDGGSHIFSLNYADPVFEGFYRIRVERVRCYLDGITAGSPGLVQLLLQTGAAFDDKSSTYDSLSFFGEPREWMFEYKANDKAIISDGILQGLDGCIKYSPFTTWKVKVRRGLETLDFTSFTGIRLQLECEVTLGPEQDS